MIAANWQRHQLLVSQPRLPRSYSSIAAGYVARDAMLKAAHVHGVIETFSASSIVAGVGCNALSGTLLTIYQ